MVLGEDYTTSDDGFGDVMILQSQPRIPTFVITGDASVFYTTNAALTRHHTIDDTFVVTTAGVSWTPVIGPGLSAQVAAHGSVFAYQGTPALDFQSLGFGAGLFWTPEQLTGVGFFARYDFIELFDRHSEEILRDHEFTLGAQKGFALSRGQGLVAGVIIGAGIAEPESAQRDQAGIFLGYQLQITHSLGLELLYRATGYCYNETGRLEANQTLAASAHYRLCRWAYINASFSLTDNHSDNSAFDYLAFSTGGGLSATVQF